jgi:alkanesulfonate monooxygenase SsuD/methylene tetrahydromethanopterin reductase-like flavin-dependent oxidoreductase (luciferase family)
VLGATANITGPVNVTNLPSRPAPLLARTVTGLSTISGGRVALGIGAGGLWDEIAKLGVPRLSPAAAIRALEEAIIVVRALSGGGEPVTFEGEFYRVAGLTPAAAPTPPIWTGSLGPKSLAMTGRHADGWIPGHAADWLSTRVAEARPIIDEAASVGRNPADVATIYNVQGRLTPIPLPETRDDEGRWIGGGRRRPYLRRPGCLSSWRTVPTVGDRRGDRILGRSFGMGSPRLGAVSANS